VSHREIEKRKVGREEEMKAGKYNLFWLYVSDTNRKKSFTLAVRFLVITSVPFPSHFPQWTQELVNFLWYTITLLFYSSQTIYLLPLYYSSTSALLVPLRFRSIHSTSRTKYP
jgi:hypothetical protein